jgi:hypothetical protein
MDLDNKVVNDWDFKQNGRRMSQLVILPKHADLAFVLGIATLIRLVIAVSTGNVKFYFPDSWDYVVIPSQPGPPRSFHPPTIWHLWNFLTLGNMTESNVITLQLGFGVFTTALLYLLIRTASSVKIAIPLILLYILTPWQYFFERTFMPESSSLFALVTLLWFLQVDSSRNRFGEIPQILFVPLLLGLLIALKPLFALFGFLTFVWIIYKKLKERKNIKLIPMALSLSLLTFAAPIILLSSTYLNSYGVFSISPGSGSVLITRWADFISCDSASLSDSELIKRAVQEVCSGSPGQIPGDGNNLLWAGTSVGRTLDEKTSFAENQKVLTQITIQNLLKNKLRFASQYLVDLSYPLAHIKEPDDLAQYANGSEWEMRNVVKKNFVNYRSWFGPQEENAYQGPGSENLRDVMAVSLPIPRVLMWLSFLILLSQLIRFRIQYKGLGLIQLIRNILTNFGFELKIAFLYIISVALMSNLSSIRNFRYDLGQIPIWILFISILLKMSLNKSDFMTDMEIQKNKLSKVLRSQ